jgi:hypothetical protein
VLFQADLCVDAIDIFPFLRHNGIGQQFALFYEAWAALLERKEVQTISSLFFVQLIPSDFLSDFFGEIVEVFLFVDVFNTHFNCQLLIISISHRFNFVCRISTWLTRCTKRVFVVTPRR